MLRTHTPNPAHSAHHHHHDAVDRELAAYNAAFEELELGWHWDRRVLDGLRSIPGERARLCAFLREHKPHLLKVYDEAFLVDLILGTKARFAAEVPVLDS
jgi:hypothetical protein